MCELYRISEHVQYIRDVRMKQEAQSESDDMLYFNQQGQTSSICERRISEDLSVLLIIYSADGAEWSISPAGTRLIIRESPRQGWFHKHEYVEILYVIEGNFTQILLGEKIRFGQGEFVITDQNCEHADYIEAENAAVLFIRVRPEYMEKLLRSYDGTDEMRQFLFHALWRQRREQSFLELKRTGEEEERRFDMERLLEVLVRENLEKEPGYEKVEQGLMIRILQHLCSDYTLQLHSDSREGREKVFLYELECFIRTNMDCITVEKLEERFHYNRNYYNLILKKYRGKSFRQYVTEIRMKYARQLLEQTDLPVRKIVRQIGYENVSHFYHLFERYYGKKPKEIRGYEDHSVSG